MDNSGRYAGISILNHWITAILVLVMLALGLAVHYAPSESVEDYVLGIHISLGFFVLWFVIWRLAFRLYSGFPALLPAPRYQRWLAYMSHRLLLILLTLQVLTGPAYLFTEGEGMDVFGWFTFYLPLAGVSVIHEPVEWLHVVTGVYVLPSIILLHFLGAIKHYLTEPQSGSKSR